MIVIRGATTIANQSRTSNFFVQHHAHLGLQHCGNVEIGNIKHVIPIHLLLLVDGRGTGRTLQKSEDFFLLHVTLNVALGASFIFGNISIDGLNAGERSVSSTVHDNTHPVHVPRNKINVVGSGASIGEEIFHVLNTMSQRALLQGAILLNVVKDGHNITMLDHIFLLLFIVIVKYIVLHYGFLLIIFRFILIFSFFERFFNKSPENFLLLLGHVINNIPNSTLFLFFRHIGLFLHIFFFICMLEFYLDRHTSINLSFKFSIISMSHDIIDIGSRISSSKDQTNFSNITMNNIRSVLTKLIGPNRQMFNIAMFYKRLRGLTILGIVKFAINTNAVAHIFENAMTKNIVHRIMLMVPYDGNYSTIVFLESIMHNDSAIATLKICSCSPAGEIIFLSHYYLSPLLHFRLQCPQSRYP